MDVNLMYPFCAIGGFKTVCVTIAIRSLDDDIGANHSPNRFAEVGIAWGVIRYE